MTNDPPRLILWGVSTGRTLRALWALHELALDYTARPIQPRTGETKSEEFTRINPRQKIPVLQDGDFTIAESPAIIAYLSETYGTAENRLVPTDPRQRAATCGDKAISCRPSTISRNCAISAARGPTRLPGSILEHSLPSMSIRPGSIVKSNSAAPPS